MKGMYRHYKGGIYSVLLEVVHADTGDNQVIYNDDKGDLWARSTEAFTAQVEVNGEMVDRFERLE